MEPKKDFDLDSRGNLLRSDKFLNTANNVLATVFNDKEIYTDPEDLVDAFYEKFRHVDSNTMDAMRLYNKIDELDEEERNDLRFVYETYRSLPTFWSDDTVNKGEAFLDYAMGILTDPFTAASVVGGSGLAAKTAASGLVMAGIKNATTAGLKTAALTGAGIDATTAVLGDKYIQESEKALKLRDEYSLGQAALAAGMSVVPGAIVGASLPALKAGYRKVRPSSTDLTKILREGKESYLNGNSAGQAYLNNEIVEGSFVQVPSTGKSIVQGEKFIKENLGYVEKINTANKTATINTGFDDAGNPIQITKQLDKLIDVVTVADLGESDFVETELMLVKLNKNSIAADDIGKFGGAVVYEDHEILNIQFVGEPDKLDTIVRDLSKKEPLEIVRSGSLGISSNSKTLTI